MSIDKVNDLLESFYNHFYSIEEFSLKQGIKTLTTTELHVIEAIGTKSITMNELSDKLKITMGTATVAINKLSEKGFIDRIRGEEDRRKVFVSLSKSGIDALNYHINFHKSIISNITKGLTEDELISFVEVFTKIIKNLENQLDYSKPTPINEFCVGTNIKIVKIKGSPAILEFFNERSIIEGRTGTLVSIDSDNLVLKFEDREVTLSLIDSKNISAIKII